MISGDWPFKGASEYLIFKQVLETELHFPHTLFSQEAEVHLFIIRILLILY